MRRNLKDLFLRRLVAWCLALCVCLGVGSEGSILTAHAKDTKPSYKIMVNRAANCVTVYEKDANGEFSIPVKTFVSSCGREGHRCV